MIAASSLQWSTATADTITSIMQRGDIAALRQVDPAGVPAALRRACADRCMFEGRRHFGIATKGAMLDLSAILAHQTTARAWMKERRRWIDQPPIPTPARIRRHRVVHASAPIMGAA